MQSILKTSSLIGYEHLLNTNQQNVEQVKPSLLLSTQLGEVI